MPAPGSGGAPTAPRASAPDGGPGVEAAGTVWLGGWVRVAVALVVAGQTMSFALATNLSPPEGRTYWLLQAGLMLGAGVVLALLAGPLLRESWIALRARRITVDLLFLVTLAGTLAVSVYGSVWRRPTVYYDLVAILLAIYTVGKMLGARSRARALQAIEALRVEHDRCVVVMADGREETRSAGAVVVGEWVRVPAGGAVPVDGRVREGRGLVLTTPLTGELEPAAFAPGDTLYAGMRSVDGVFLLEVTAAGGARRLDAMLGEVAAARLKPSRVQLEADRLAARFVPLVVGVSVLTFGGWLLAASLDRAIINSLAVMVVACPCALGLATPLGIWSGLVRLSRLGLVARTGDLLESLATADVVLFDKTGTLCEPELAVRALAVLPGAPMSPTDLRAALAAAEAGVDHPVAAAVRRLGPDGEGGPVFRQLEARVVPACGIRARIAGPDGARVHEVAVGEPAWISTLVGADVPTAGARREIAVAIDGQLAARIELDETPRARAGAVFARLAALGLPSVILTGDRNFPASVWPDIPRRTGMTPEAKAEEVRARQARGEHVVYIGDGLNDAPALAAADASIAVRQGADLARSSAMAVLAGESLASLPQAVVVARDVRAAIRSNLWLAAGYNAIGMAVAGAGWLHPVAAALLMAGSSIVVSTRVLRAGGGRAAGVATAGVDADA
ncbi:MAG: cation-translocating P-type ATPase [Opitutaceae bacterium]|nr:cation-translocating P-type ATPase [Opitutaceae bacterium]